MEMIMSPQTMFCIMNGNDIDLDMSFYTLEDAIDMVEFQESLNCEDYDNPVCLELPDMEEM